MDPHDELTVEQAATLLEVSPRQVRWYHAKGHLPGRRIGARVLVFPRADVEKLIGNKPKKTGRPPKNPPEPPPPKPTPPAKPKRGKKRPGPA